MNTARNSSMNSKTKKLAAITVMGLLGLLNRSSLPAQNAPTEMIGSHYHDPDEKAAESFSRGLKAKRKAEGESDPEKKRKLLTKAKDELSKSVGYVRNFDSLLALGQVYLALGSATSARDSCSVALGYKPENADAKSCIDLASQALAAAKVETAGPGH